MKKGLWLRAPVLLLLAFGLCGLAQALGRLEKGRLLSASCLGDEDEDLFRSAKVLVVSDQGPGGRQKELFSLTELLGVLEKAVGGTERALGRLHHGLARLEEAVSQLAK